MRLSGLWIVGTLVFGDDNTKVDDQARKIDSLCAAGDTKCNQRLQGLFDMFESDEQRRRSENHVHDHHDRNDRDRRPSFMSEGSRDYMSVYGSNTQDYNSKTASNDEKKISTPQSSDAQPSSTGSTENKADFQSVPSSNERRHDMQSQDLHSSQMPPGWMFHSVSPSSPQNFHSMGASQPAPWISQQSRSFQRAQPAPWAPHGVRDPRGWMSMGPSLMFDSVNGRQDSRMFQSMPMPWRFESMNGPQETRGFQNIPMSASWRKDSIMGNSDYQNMRSFRDMSAGSSHSRYPIYDFESESSMPRFGMQSVEPHIFQDVNSGVYSGARVDYPGRSDWQGHSHGKPHQTHQPRRSLSAMDHEMMMMDSEMSGGHRMLSSQPGKASARRLFGFEEQGNRGMGGGLGGGLLNPLEDVARVADRMMDNLSGDRHSGNRYGDRMDYGHERYNSGNDRYNMGNDRYNMGGGQYDRYNNNNMREDRNDRYRSEYGRNY